MGVAPPGKTIGSVKHAPCYASCVRRMSRLLHLYHCGSMPPGAAWRGRRMRRPDDAQERKGRTGTGGRALGAALHFPE